MLRKPSWIFPAIHTSAVMLVAVSAAQTAHAATDTCLAAPNGAAPKGQHWYYHSDRATQKKCWFLREAVANPTANAVSPVANGLARPAAPAETVRPAKPTVSSRPPVDAAAQPSGASVDGSNPSQSDQANAAFAAPTAAAPLQPAGDRTAPQGGAMPWPAPPAPAGAQEADTAPSGAAAVAVSNTTDTPAATMHQDADMPRDTTPVSAAAPEQPSRNSMGDDLLIIAAAAALAAAVYAIFAMIFRRKPGKAESADFFTRFNPDPGRRGVDRSQSPARKPQSRPVQPSFIPQQLTTPRPLVATGQQERVQPNQRARPDQPSAPPARAPAARAPAEHDLPMFLKTAKPSGGSAAPSRLARVDQAIE